MSSNERRIVGKSIPGKPSCELRYWGSELDEVCANKVDNLHFEVMSDTSIWGSIEVGGKRYDLWFCAKNGRSHIWYDVSSVEKLPERALSKVRRRKVK